jgi:hypothetical protein
VLREVLMIAQVGSMKVVAHMANTHRLDLIEDI